MAGKYVAPHVAYGPVAYTCPRCVTLVGHSIEQLGMIEERNFGDGTVNTVESAEVRLKENERYKLFDAICLNCNHHILWAVPIIEEVVAAQPSPEGAARPQLTGKNDKPAFEQAIAIYPEINRLPPCNADAPEAAAAIYQEAAAVYGRSNRAAAALVRVATESLLQEHFESDLRLNDLIEKHKAALGKFYSAAHTLRLVGNDGAHPTPEMIDLNEDAAEIVEGLFKLFNSVVDHLITQPREYDELMGTIGGRSKKAIPGHEPDAP